MAKKIEKTEMQVRFEEALAARANIWLPASGGTEEPFVARNGRRLQYMFNCRSGKHAYLDLGSDIFLTTDEALSAINGW